MKDLKQRAVKSVFWVAVANVVGKVIATLAIIVLARQLDPSDFGVYSIITTIISLCLIIVSFGFDLWYVRAQDNERKRYALFVKVSILSIILISILLFASAGLISNFYDTDILKPMIRYLSVYFLIGGSIQLFYQYLAKHLEFKKTSIAAVIRQIIQAMISISLALYLHNAYALFWGYIAGGIIEFIILFLGVRKDFIRAILDFGKVNIRTGIKTHWKFTGSTVSAQLVNASARLVPSPILSKTFGFSSSGLYTTMDNTISAPISLIIGSITTTSLAILSKVPKKQLSGVSLNIVRQITKLSMPFFILLWIFADELLLILFGPEWTEGANILRLIMIPTLLSITVSPISQNFIILNKPHWLLYWNLSLLAGSITTIVVGSLFTNLAITIFIFCLFNSVMRLTVQVLLAKLMLINSWSFVALYFEDFWQWAIIISISLIIKFICPSNILILLYIVLVCTVYYYIQYNKQKSYYRGLVQNIFATSK